MDVGYFLDLLVDSSDQLIRVYDLNNDAECIFEGYANEIPYEIEMCEISSIDNVYRDNSGYIGINIELESED